MNPRANHTNPTNDPNRRPTAGGNRRLPDPAHRSAPNRGRVSCQHGPSDAQRVNPHTLWQLRAFIGLLIALLLISVAHAVKDGLTAGLALGLTLTTLLLLAALGLWRIGSRSNPDATTPPTTRR